MTPEHIVHSPAFLSRRTQNWLVLGFTYAAMYMARYNFGFANKSLSDTYGWDKTQVGTIISTATLVYGISAMFNGPIADRLGGRRAMLIGVVRRHASSTWRSASAPTSASSAPAPSCSATSRPYGRSTCTSSRTARWP